MFCYLVFVTHDRLLLPDSCPALKATSKGKKTKRAPVAHPNDRSADKVFDHVPLPQFGLARRSQKRKLVLKQEEEKVNCL